MSAFDRLLGIDQRLTRRMQVAEQPGKRRALFSLLAHSGDFVVLARRGFAVVGVWRGVLAPKSPGVGVRHPGDCGHCAGGQVHHPPPPPGRQLGRVVPQNRPALVSIRTCGAGVYAGGFGSLAGSALVRSGSAALGAAGNPGARGYGRALSIGCARRSRIWRLDRLGAG